MESSVVRKRLIDTIDRARRRAAARRVRNEEAAPKFGHLLELTAIPLFRQMGNVRRAEGYQFTVFTPSGSVRLMSDRRAEDFIELLLDTSGDEPHLVLHSSRGHGRGVVEIERAIGDPATLTEDDLLAAM